MHILNPPLVEGALEAYRSSGYTFATSVADLVDNAIGLGEATRIHMNFEITVNGDLTFFLADNGIGMTQDQLTVAMALGSSGNTKKHALSKFGHGMKTASWAHAKKLTVVSRPTDSPDVPCGAAWDLDDVTTAGEWRMEIIEKIPAVYLDYLDELDGKRPGTIVIWEKIDRLLTKYKDSTGNARKKATATELAKVKEHLGMVFHRYLDPNFKDAKTVQIFINGQPVVPWDPFAEAYGNWVQPTMTRELTHENRTPIIVTPYLLPKAYNWTSDDNYEESVKRDAELQGFYLYRADRLIQKPSWLGLGKSEPHANLARVKIDINPDWDEDLHVDVKKSTVAFPSAQRDELDAVKRQISGLAKKQKDTTERRPSVTGDSHVASSASIDRHKSAILRAQVLELSVDGSQATLQNQSGQVNDIRVVQPAPGLPVNINVSQTGLQDGGLWDTIVIFSEEHGTEPALQLSATHEFYKRVYIPASISPAGKTAADMIFWAMAQAELAIVSDKTKEVFENFRHEISRSLRQLARELPEPDESLDLDD